MKKILLFLVLACFTNSSADAKNRTSIEASKLASQFVTTSVNGLSKGPSSTVSSLTLTYTSLNKSTSKNGSGALYYVFDKGSDNGYVIVSGDDRAKTILGYSDSGHFDFTALPANMKDWLVSYENEIRNLPDTVLRSVTFSEPTVSKVKAEETGSFLTAISPLLGSIKWDQGSPYNDLCPVVDSINGGKAVTGCVATGMAQVMRYHKWPVQGTGSNSYTTATLKIPLSLDFSNTIFDWDNMTETYSSSSTVAQKSAVANLMYNCGVAVSMNYNTSSGANTEAMAIALKTNFGYDANLQHYSRDYFNRAEWVNLLKIELNASRPVLYRGNTNDAGHLFVCDGYDSNDLFHFNWGWGGSSNGYFQISALDPAEQGIGSSVGGYNAYQAIVTGLQKPNAASVPVYLMHTYKALTASADSVARAASFSVIATQIYNLGVNLFTGYLGIALYNSGGFVQVLKYSSLISGLKNNYGWNTYTSSTTLPSNIANGNYKIYYVYKASTESSWQIVRGKVGTPNYLNVTVSSSKIYFKQPTDVYPALKLNSFTVTGNLYKDKTGRFNVNVTNTGAEYNSILGIYLQSATNDTIYQLVTTERVNIATGETRNLLFTGTISMEPGQYSLTTLYDPGNNSSIATQIYPLGTEQTVSVLAAPTSSPLLTLSNLITLPNPTTVDKANAVLTAKIKNTSGFFDSKVIAFVFATSGGSSLTYIGYQDAIFDTNEEKTLTFSGPIDLTPGQYKLAVYYLNASNTWTKITPTSYSSINFTLVDNHTAINELSDSRFELYPNPVRDNLKLRTDASIRKIVVTDLLGKQLKVITQTTDNLISIPVAGLKPGTYLIRVETDSESKTMKFIKD
jgi:hypothetical protein